MQACYQFADRNAEHCPIKLLNEQICNDLFDVDPGESLHHAFFYLTLQVSPGGESLHEIAGDSEKPDDVRKVALYLVQRGFTAHGWLEHAGGRTWVTPQERVLEQVFEAWVEQNANEQFQAWLELRQAEINEDEMYSA